MLGIKLLVCGGRDFKDKKLAFDTLDELHRHQPIDLLINGFAPGADWLADTWACERGIQPVRCAALWDFHRTSAGPRRNRLMIRLQPDLVLAFPGGNGTADMVAVARDAGIPVVTIKKD